MWWEPCIRIGILAYGSLIDDPGEELAQRIIHRIEDAKTPFRVEFARSSLSREGAPTLVPVEAGGAQVKATVLVLDDAVALEDARDMLYRREVLRQWEEVVTSWESWNV